MNRLAGLSVYFTAGVAGGLAAGLMLWLACALGLDTPLGPGASPMAWFWPRLAWFGLWGLAFATPMPGLSLPVKGLFIALGPTVVRCLVVFPLTDAGFLGLSLGQATPVIVLVHNLAWGLVAALWIKFAGIREKEDPELLEGDS